MVLKWLWGVWSDLFDLDNPNDIENDSEDDPSPLDEEMWGFVVKVISFIFLLVTGKNVRSSKKIRRKKGCRVSNAR